MRLGEVPIVVPRRKDQGVVINDHQLELAGELSRIGWCRVVSDTEELIACLESPPAVVPVCEDISNRKMRQMVSEFIG